MDRAAGIKYKPAKWWSLNDKGKILCTLCPRYCTIGNNQAGFCYIRQNIDGKLYTLGYGHPTGFAIDPIEKKPLFHFMPGSKILSFGTAGCNLGCKFCQNWSISKAKLDAINSVEASPEDVVNIALKYKTPSIAFTYNDPVIFGEYVIDISRLARERNIKTVMVTAGYIDKEARKEVFQYIDAANVDLKAFTEEFYHKLTFSHLQPVLDTLQWLHNETDVWFEITTLLIPGENDSGDEIKRMCEWILKNLSDRVPLHFTAFHPDFKMRNKPPTPPSTLVHARNIALNMGIKYCYTGNVHNIEGQTTYCPECGNAVIKRDWHSILEISLTEGRCNYCSTKIDGRFFLL
ncbi:Pyruvate-formate lyase-activating enzyme [Melioribacter roseus P3M-2]|uniref:Pyruvate-formate lyase-activating enzyme n=1 Tax=Melioribacter roseus (strain DSM 23840 / JCM 17771 / VKM B-2668 / P3M-2) TaxID=1191523 RepID=I6Z630_MELRP|nr:AmmeMemoRadiSam system radical SAM enzyme [Melioribacter roseus]AFN74620.1 Pyruvate-formate lyase-activating enzyme [Melioribacter roseus P3M-2]